MKLTIRVTALCAALLALAVAGCGSSSKSTSSSAAQAPPASTTSSATPTTPTSSATPPGGASSNLQLAADSSGQLKFDKSSLSAKAGNVTITLTNPSPVPHAISVQGNGINKGGSTVTTGGKSTVTANLQPGTYTFYCPVDGHRAAGMQGTLTVK
jgi:plastocyanin